MKHLSIYILLSFCLLTTACNDDYLERYPLDEVSPQTFLKSESEMETYVNGLYTYLPGSGIFSADFQSDNVEKKTYDLIVAGQHTIETDAGAAGWTWSYLRDVNFFLENYAKAEIDEPIKNHYAGVARFFRAWFYFDKVKRFGDVPWYSGTLNTDNDALYKPRDDRKMVMDSVLADLNFATEYIENAAGEGKVNRWVALALKARICLHEGTFRKYHGIVGAEQWVEQAYLAAQEVMESGEYSLYSTGDPENDYRNLFTANEYISEEVMLPRVYEYSLEVTHTANGVFITPTLGAPGLTKSLINTYLMKDGTPFTALPGYDTLSFYTEMQDRDPRLAQTIRTPGYSRSNNDIPLVPNFDNAPTGYQGIKYVMGTDYDGYNSNENDLPVFRYAEVLLIYAEAKAELGELTQADLDMSINLIRARAGMPPMQLNGLMADPVLTNRYPNVAGAQQAAILEIRRERRVELALEGFRYDDLMRWKVGDLLAQTFQGMYFSHTGEVDLDRDGTPDVALVEEEPAERLAGIQYLKLGEVISLSKENQGKVEVHPDVNKTFEDPKHYFFPLPRTELLLNEQLVQNTGW